MNRSSLLRSGPWVLAALGLALAALVVPGRACAPVARDGVYVSIPEESAVILWDSKTKTQEFIRRASFRTPTPDFGFLVPTPSQPYLKESKDELFTNLDDWTKPEVRTQVVRTPPPGARGELADNAPKAGVEVLAEQRVAGYDTAILKATDARALNAWLGKHGYASRPELTAWLDVYVKAGWYLTAFKIARKQDGSPEVSTAAVRMTFQTDRPFFPYREPADQRAGARASPGPRLLRVFFLGDARFEARLGNAGQAGPARSVWSNTLSAQQLDQVARLTVLEDRSSPRPGTDELYFVPSEDQSTQARPPVIHYVYQDGPEPGNQQSQSIGLWVVIGAGLLMISILAAVYIITRNRPASE